MKIKNLLNSLAKYFIVATLIILSGTVYSQEEIQKLYMGIKLNNVLCGYSEIFIRDIEGKSEHIMEIVQNVYITFKALDKDIEQHQIFTYRINKSTGNFIYHDSYMKQGKHETAGIMEVIGDSIYINDTINGKLKIEYLPEGTILPNTIYYSYMVDDLGINNKASMTYHVFNSRSGEVRKMIYKKLGMEKLKLNEDEYESVIVSETDPLTGMEVKYWIDVNSGLRLKMESKTGISIYLSDISVKDKLGVGNWDEIIFIKTNKYIRNINTIASMEVDAELSSVPFPIMEDLNCPGQVFKGDLKDNLIKGIFMVNHQKYNGQNAEIFNSDVRFDSEIQDYLEADDMIESDNPELAKLAREVTKESKDYWEATLRLSNWVADSIDGSVLFGTAYETYSRREGACGSQSMLLAALCRSVGIPARVVWGCLYTPAYGGSFGSHGWNEIYMGEDAGWVPLDVTINETDYINSGHLRIGIFKTSVILINFIKMDILNYSVK